MTIGIAQLGRSSLEIILMRRICSIRPNEGAIHRRVTDRITREPVQLSARCASTARPDCRLELSGKCQLSGGVIIRY